MQIVWVSFVFCRVSDVGLVLGVPGRVVIAAAERRQAHCVGIEQDPGACAKAKDGVRQGAVFADVLFIAHSDSSEKEYLIVLELVVVRDLLKHFCFSLCGQTGGNLSWRRT